MSEQTALPMAARIARREALAAAGAGIQRRATALADKSTTQPAPAIEPAGSGNYLFDDANNCFAAGWSWRSD